MTIMIVRDSATEQDLEEDRVGQHVVDAAFQVHKALGPGLLESVYEACLVEELKERSISVESQKALPVMYKGKKLDAGFRIDILAADAVVVEIKAVENLLPVHEAQMLTYLRLSGKRLGYLINFNTPLLKDGVKRMVRRK